ncbi:tRNA (adenosine(37)-N6)-threonylcarbamoyltransferase complex transferase subunit TsaD [Fibrobacterota bacterium]
MTTSSNFKKNMFTLGIETSCDETACGIVDQDLNVMANKIYSQEEHHKAYGGVVPEIAARAHLEKISPIVSSALQEAGRDIADIDVIAFTRGPGLIGSLLVGSSFATGMGRALGKPVFGISHLEGHLAAAYLSDNTLAPPFLCLTVSGGHTELCVVEEYFTYRVLGRTRDDAAGEAFDKCGKIMGLGYPAGPRISRLAEKGKRDYIILPKGLDVRNNYEFSYSGVKTAFVRFIESVSEDHVRKNRENICAALEFALVEILVKKTIRAMEEKKIYSVAVCGGVSANTYLRQRFREETEKRGYRAVIPHIALCTDNGAMIAGMAQMRFNHGKLTRENAVFPSLSWPD